MVLFNINNYYKHLIAQLDYAVQEGFLSQAHRDKVVVCDNIADILNIILQDLHTAPVSPHAI